MKTPSHSVLCVLLPLLVFVSSSSAEDQNKTVSVTFSVIPLSSMPYAKMYYRDGEEVKKLEMRKGRRSAPHKLSPSEFLELYTDHPDPEQQYRLIGKAPVIAGTNKILFFFWENEARKPKALPIRLYGIDDSTSTFPDGSFRFVNFINAPLVIEFNKKRFGLEARQSVVRKLNLPEEGEFTPFVVKDREGYLLGGTRLFSHASSRELVLIFPPKKGKKRLDIRYFSD